MLGISLAGRSKTDRTRVKLGEEAGVCGCAAVYRPHPVLQKRELSIIGCCESLSWYGLHRAGARAILGHAVFKQGGRQRCKQYS
jgi:hypothetical protein